MNSPQSKGSSKTPERKVRRKAKKSKPPGYWGRTRKLAFRAVWAFGWRMATILFIILAISTIYFYSSLPTADSLVDGRTKGSVTFFDRNGKIFSWWGEQFGGQLTVDTVSPHLINALIAVEDKRFYRHLGVSPRGIIGAIIINMREGRSPFVGHGGSTITQQVGKLLCFNKPYDSEKWPEPRDYEKSCRTNTLWRKVKEIPFALALELKYTKDEILMVYLNRAYLGAGATGFEAASQRYFGKRARTLTLGEAALLAGLLKAPSRYAPTRNLTISQQRANLVVSLMEDQGYISPNAARDAINNPAQLFPESTNKSGGHYVDWILQTAPGFLTYDTREDVEIQTTFDLTIQKALEDAVREVFSTKIYKGSNVELAVVTMSRDGAVLGMVGGKNFEASGLFNRASSAFRQTGSLFKPIVFAAGLERGLNYRDTYIDEPISVRLRDGKTWTPKNYESKYFGTVTLTEAMAKSLNSVAVQILLAVGRDRVASIARKLGLKSQLVSGPSLALGTSEATLLEMTGIYTGILSGGWEVIPYGIEEIRLKGEDTVLFRMQGKSGQRAISGSTARQLVYMLNQVIEQGTGQRAKMEHWQSAGKTGTTQSAKDAWFIGFTSNYVTGVWMGYDNNRPLKNVTGGGLPAEIWRLAMEKIHSGMKPIPLL
ncbi:MAG: PBP1A family penicillin-binding protein [Rhodobacteraceae bacterium]|nr:PBP1A family penicillin-binding protein [Paracoccaceae bacterium]MYF46030.1 PBP1A family penicillin-binding protein [Paracoccaceae bacterium]MYI92451.1 PBP1A family penicillin-binding protein [Paracoccaceae bacterium]